MDLRKSSVWAHFDVIDDRKKTKCHYCGIELSFVGSSTSSMLKHLQNRHPLVKLVRNNYKTLTTSTNLDITANSTNENIDESIINEKGRIIALPQNVMKMCVKDLQPLGLVGGEGFQQFCTALNSTCTMPSLDKVQYCLLKEHETRKKGLKQVISSVSGVAFSLDSWKSCTMESYVTVSGHFLVNEWDLKSAVLGTRKVEDGKNTLEILYSIQKEFEIEHIHGVTYRDELDNVKELPENFQHVACFADSLRWVMEGAFEIPEIKNVISQARKLAEFMSKDFLEILVSGYPVRVCTDSKARWLTTYRMCERLIELKIFIGNIFLIDQLKESKHLMLMEYQWVLLEGITAALKPIASATEFLSTEEYAPASAVYPIVFALMKNHLVPCASDLNHVASMKSRISNSLQIMFMKDRSWLSPLMIATALDPRFKSLKFLDSDQRSEVQALVVKLMEESDSPHIDSMVTGAPVTGSTPPEHGIKEETPVHHVHSTNGLILNNVLDVDEDMVTLRNARIEYGEFQAAESTVIGARSGQSFTLDWWKQNAMFYPRVVIVAKRYLCIPGTSAPSEHVFTSTGLTIAQQRASLEPDAVDAMIFLNGDQSSISKVPSMSTNACFENNADTSDAKSSVVLTCLREQVGSDNNKIGKERIIGYFLNQNMQQSNKRHASDVSDSATTCTKKNKTTEH